MNIIYKKFINYQYKIIYNVISFKIKFFLKFIIIKNWFKIFIDYNN